MMPWAHLPQKMARWGERAGRRRQPRSRRAPRAGCRPLRAVPWAQTAPTAQASALDRGLKSPVPRRTHPCHLRPQRASTAPQRAREIIATRSAQLGSSVWALRMSRFIRGVQVDLVNRPSIGCRKAADLYVSSAKSARARNSKNGRGQKQPVRYKPSKLLRKLLGADRAPGRQIGFWSNQP